MSFIHTAKDASGYLITVFLLLFCSCSASGPKFIQVAQTFPSVPPGMARVYFLRPYQTMYSGADARISVQGMAIGKLPNNGFFYQDLNAGTIQISVDYWGAPGSYQEYINLEAGRSYYGLVSNRSGSVVGTALLGPIGQLGEYAVAEGRKDGPFQILFLSEQQGMAELQTLSFSRN